MNEELIDLLYETESVEGIALFGKTGLLKENQLALGEDSVKKMGLALADIQKDLAEAKRGLFGFLIKTDSYLLTALTYGDSIILLQLHPGHGVNDTYKKIRSQLGKAKPSYTSELSMEFSTEPFSSPISRDTRSHPPLYAESRTASNTKPTPAPAPAPAPDQLIWAVFRSNLTTIMKSIAPIKIVNRHIDQAAAKAGVTGIRPYEPIRIAITVGHEAISRLPNSGRRRTIRKKYLAYISKFSALEAV